MSKALLFGVVKWGAPLDTHPDGNAALPQWEFKKIFWFFFSVFPEERLQKRVAVDVCDFDRCRMVFVISGIQRSSTSGKCKAGRRWTREEADFIGAGQFQASILRWYCTGGFHKFGRCDHFCQCNCFLLTVLFFGGEQVANGRRGQFEWFLTTKYSEVTVFYFVGFHFVASWKRIWFNRTVQSVANFFFVVLHDLLFLASHVHQACWRRSSVVTMSIFGLKTFPARRLICVGKLSAMDQPTRPIQLSIPLGSVNE